MATQRITRNRTGPEPLEIVLELGPFATDFEPRNRETAGKNRSNRTKELRAGLPGPNRFTWTTGFKEPPRNREPGGSPGPAVLWNRPKASH